MKTDDDERDEEEPEEPEEEPKPGPFDGPAHFSNWTTSKRAAEELAEEGKLKTQRMRVYHTLATDGPLACYQTMARTGLPHQTVSARVCELVERHMAERLKDVLRNPTTDKMQEKVRALPPIQWRDFQPKPKKKELIQLLCEALLAFVRVPELWATDEYNQAMKVLELAGWKIEDQNGGKGTEP